MKYILALAIFISGVFSFSGAAAQKLDTVRTKTEDGHEFIQVKNHDRITEDGYMLNGLFDGAWTTYWDNGYPKDIKIFRNGKMNGLHVSIDVTGYTSLLETFRDNILNGPRRVFNKGAMRAEEAYYVNGKKDGPYKRWYFAGNIQEESTFSQDKRVGRSIWYFDNKNKAAEYDYKDGEIDGMVTTYYENGKVSEVTNYKMGNQTGDGKEFYDNGNLKATGNYKDGQKEGLWKQYDIDGKPTKTIKYHNGEEKK